MSRQLLVNKIKTPDGTILESRHRHDFLKQKGLDEIEFKKLRLQELKEVVK